jgi:hypothetical protein
MRWFLLADVPRELRPQGRGRRRTDHYHLPSLSPHTALKWRGAPPRLEEKVRVGRVELETWCGVPGFVERWSKQRVPQRHAPTERDWRAVTKEVWVADGVEIARVSIEGDVVWTYCVDLDVAREPGRSSFRPWRPLLAAAEADSYAGFLARRVARRGERLAS